jgi:hypothetical protein
MTRSPDQIAVYLEIGKHRTLAGAFAWPGWLRGGRDEEAALRALVEYGTRYERVLHDAGLSFNVPADSGVLAVVERLEGNTTTDFGAPDIAPSVDAAPMEDTELRRLQGILKACWLAFDTATQATQGRELRKGPRGGGRELAGIVEHVLGAEASYLASLGGKLPKQGYEGDPIRATEQRRKVILDAMEAAARGEFPSVGPRGGARWTPRYFVRRAAWHILDHVWELEDRVL